MARNRKSAKKAGSSFERSVADYLSKALGESKGERTIDRQVKNGSKDQGDIRGLYLHGKKVAVECKDYGGKHELPDWLRQAEAERGNADAEYGVVVWKRRGTTKPEEQFVTLTLETFAAMLAGGRDLIHGGNN